MKELPQERLIVAVHAGRDDGAGARAHRSTTSSSARPSARQIIEFQNTQFELAECKTEATIAKVFLDHCIERHVKGELDTVDRLDGQILAHRHARQSDRPLPAIVRRLWLYGRISDLARCTGMRAFCASMRAPTRS